MQAGELMKLQLFAIILLIGLSFADFTAEYEHLGYGTLTTTGTEAVPMVGEVLILAGVALIYIALVGMKKEGV